MVGVHQFSIKYVYLKSTGAGRLTPSNLHIENRCQALLYKKYSSEVCASLTYAMPSERVSLYPALFIQPYSYGILMRHVKRSCDIRRQHFPTYVRLKLIIKEAAPCQLIRRSNFTSIQVVIYNVCGKRCFITSSLNVHIITALLLQKRHTAVFNCSHVENKEEREIGLNLK